MPKTQAVLCGWLAVAFGCGDDKPPDPGSLCACRRANGEQQCCFGHGVCEPQPEGPDRCACDEGARGITCATAAPGVHPVAPRPCVGDDPGCVQQWAHVAVESFDSCVDLDGEPFDSIVVRPSADARGAWPGPAGSFPAAIFVHGASQEPGNYFDLFEHLAANGVVVAAFDATVAGDVTSRANRLLSYLECLRSSWADAAFLDQRYALIGHSRGGSAAPLAAQAIADGLTGEGATIEAVVALAPANVGQFAVTSTSTPAYLAIQGARDPDTTGAAVGWFDLADPTTIKALTWVYGAGHQRFHQGLFAGASGEAEATLSGPEHWVVARAYLGGFVLWRLLGREAYREYFTGASVPLSVAAIWHLDDPAVFSGLVDGTAAQMTIADFEAGTLDPSNLGAAVTTRDLLDALVGDASGFDEPYSGAQRGGALRVSWQLGAADPAVRFEIPPAMADIRDHAVLRLRVGRPLGVAACAAAAQNHADLALLIADAQTSHEVRLSELGTGGRVPTPESFDPETFGAWFDETCHGVDFLTTVRVPLEPYCQAGVDLAAVTHVELRFDGATATTLVVDDIAFERGETELRVCQ